MRARHRKGESRPMMTDDSDLHLQIRAIFLFTRSAQDDIFLQNPESEYMRVNYMLSDDIYV
jgi:hypothetical protein